MVSFRCSLTRANSGMACFPDALVRDALSIPNTYITHTKADADDRLTNGSACVFFSLRGGPVLQELMAVTSKSQTKNMDVLGPVR